jgi:hypothetical protein
MMPPSYGRKSNLSTGDDISPFFFGSFMAYKEETINAILVKS